VTGVVREAATLEQLKPDDGFLVRVSAADAERAYVQARSLADAGVDALLSFGFAGGLDPMLGPGAAIIADQVHAVSGPWIDAGQDRSLMGQLNALFSIRRRFVDHVAQRQAPPPIEAQASYAADARLIDRLRIAAGPRAMIGPIAGVDRVVATRTEKAALIIKTRAHAADMESAGVARAAHEAGLPFGVLRVVFDASNRELPSWLMRTVRPDGTTTLKPLLPVLLLNPFEAATLISLSIDALFALRALRRVGRRLRPALLGGL
jgi:adenosylhomocysteine nucleosidase